MKKNKDLSKPVFEDSPFKNFEDALVKTGYIPPEDQVSIPSTKKKIMKMDGLTRPTSMRNEIKISQFEQNADQ